MPLGFGRSILSKPIVAAGVTRDAQTWAVGASDDSGAIQSTTVKFGSGAWDRPAGGTGWHEIGSDATFLDNQSAFTIETWYYRDTTGEAYNHVGGNWGGPGGGTTERSYLFGFNGSNIVCFYSYGSSTGSISGGGGTTLAWKHLALVSNGTNLSLFHDGSRVATTTTGVGSINNTTLGNPFKVGNTGNGQSAGYDGKFDDYRISQVARYDPTLTSYTVPTAAFTNDSDTLALFHFEEGNGNTPVDDNS